MTEDFTLVNATMGQINGTVNVDDDLMDNQQILLSFRHQAGYIDSNGTTWIEIKSLTQSDGASNDGSLPWLFNATLPDLGSEPGEYRVVAALVQDHNGTGQIGFSVIDEQGQNATLGDVLTFDLSSSASP